MIGCTAKLGGEQPIDLIPNLVPALGDVEVVNTDGPNDLINHVLARFGAQVGDESFRRNRRGLVTDKHRHPKLGRAGRSSTAAVRPSYAARGGYPAPFGSCPADRGIRGAEAQTIRSYESQKGLPPVGCHSRTDRIGGKPPKFGWQPWQPAGGNPCGNVARGLPHG